MYADRADAGEALGAALLRDPGAAALAGAVVLGLPRGGVPVAAAVARRLGATLDVVVARKVGAPSQTELAMGALARFGGPVRIVRNNDVIARRRIARMDFDRVVRRETQELRRREALYRGQRPPAELAGRTAILVDDGLATGATMRAAVQALALAEPRPAAIVVAAPIGAIDTCAELGASEAVSAVVCPWQPVGFSAVGEGYRRFDQTDDALVIALLRAASAAEGRTTDRSPRPPGTR
jgi:putative phosphoribosyl transferase